VEARQWEIVWANRLISKDRVPVNRWRRLSEAKSRREAGHGGPEGQEAEPYGKMW
jgi:hypothetical protein